MKKEHKKHTIDRRAFKKEGEENTDFISCVAFGKGAEFAEKYLKKGTKIVVCGRIQTGSYTNKDGAKIYTTDVIVEEHDFAESKNSSGSSSNETSTDADFMEISQEDKDSMPF